MNNLIRQRWYACDNNGVPSWKLKVYSKHKNVIWKNAYGVIEVKFKNNRTITLDKISNLRKDTYAGQKLLHQYNCSGFLETETPTNNQLMAYREEWTINEY